MNRIAIVTGGSRGLGRNMALHLARAGHDVIVTYKSRQDEAHEVQKQVEALGRKAAVLPLDAGDTASFAAFARRPPDLTLSHRPSTRGRHEP